MTTINSSVLSAYSPSFTVNTNKNQAEQSTESGAAAVGASGTTKVKADLGGAQVAPAASSGSSTEQAIERLKKQIEEAKKQLQEQQAQLAQAQNGEGTPEEKAQRAAAIQAQIANTSAQLMTLQSSLLQLQSQGSINTTA